MAKALGSAPRAVGNAMRKNPFAPKVPCHRILAADRTIGGGHRILLSRESKSDHIALSKQALVDHGVWRGSIITRRWNSYIKKV